MADKSFEPGFELRGKGFELESEGFESRGEEFGLEGKQFESQGKGFEPESEEFESQGKDFEQENTALAAEIAAALNIEATLARIKQNAAATRHWTIVVVEIVNSASAPATGRDQLLVRRALYDNILPKAFDDSGIPFKNCHVEDRGDGALILVPPQYPRATFASEWQDRLLFALHRCNAAHAEQLEAKLLIALHYGEVYANSDGVVSREVNLAFRILHAQEAIHGLERTSAPFAVILSDDFYRDVVVRKLAADPSTYASISVPGKSFNTRAWLRLAGVAAPAPRGDWKAARTSRIDHRNP